MNRLTIPLLLIACTLFCGGGARASSEITCQGNLQQHGQAYTCIDTSGISPAAIQGVHELVKHQRDRIATLEVTVEAQNTQLSDLKQEPAESREAADARLSDLEEKLLDIIADAGR